MMKKLFLYLMCCLTISVAALTFASCSNDDDENDNFVTCPTDGTVVENYPCTLYYDDANNAWMIRPLSMYASPFGGGDCDSWNVYVRNITDEMKAYKDKNVLITGIYTIDKRTQIGSGQIFEASLYITTIAPYDGWCGTEE